MVLRRGLSTGATETYHFHPTAHVSSPTTITHRLLAFRAQIKPVVVVGIPMNQHQLPRDSVLFHLSGNMVRSHLSRPLLLDCCCRGTDRVPMRSRTADALWISRSADSHKPEHLPGSHHLLRTRSVCSTPKTISEGS